MKFIRLLFSLCVLGFGLQVPLQAMEEGRENQELSDKAAVDTEEVWKWIIDYVKENSIDSTNRAIFVYQKEIENKTELSIPESVQDFVNNLLETGDSNLLSQFIIFFQQEQELYLKIDSGIKDILEKRQNKGALFTQNFHVPTIEKQEKEMIKKSCNNVNFETRDSKHEKSEDELSSDEEEYEEEKISSPAGNKSIDMQIKDAVKQKNVDCLMKILEGDKNDSPLSIEQRIKISDELEKLLD